MQYVRRYLQPALCLARAYHSGLPPIYLVTLRSALSFTPFVFDRATSRSCSLTDVLTINNTPHSGVSRPAPVTGETIGMTSRGSKKKAKKASSAKKQRSRKARATAHPHMVTQAADGSLTAVDHFGVPLVHPPPRSNDTISFSSIFPELVARTPRRALCAALSYGLIPPPPVQFGGMCVDLELDLNRVVDGEDAEYEDAGYAWQQRATSLSCM